jgi:hypothetical protein
VSPLTTVVAVAVAGGVVPLVLTPNPTQWVVVAVVLLTYIQQRLLMELQKLVLVHTLQQQASEECLHNLLLVLPTLLLVAALTPLEETALSLSATQLRLQQSKEIKHAN